MTHYFPALTRFRMQALSLLVLLLGAGLLAQAQCPAGNVTLSSQADVDAFPPGCGSLPASLRIQGSDITSLRSLSALQSIGGVLQILSNDQLTNLSGLNSLSSVGGNMQIGFHSQLSSLSGLNGLSRVGGELRIDNNAQLSSLSVLNSLSNIGGNLTIINNSQLSSLSGLNSLSSIGGNLFILDNAQLSGCAIAPICQYLANPPGTVIIQNNAPGCGSQDEVRQICTLPLAITTQPPSSSTACVGATVTASIATSGTVGAYQWFQNGQPVAGQTTATLSLTSVQPSQAGAYVVVVSNSVRSLTSTAFNLSVTTPVPINLSNDGPLGCARPTVTLTAAPLVQGTYVFSTSAVQNGANTATVSQTGVYSVTLTSAGGCTSTAQTTVTAISTPPTPFVATQSTPEGLAVQVAGGVSYERVRVIDRINGYEIRQTEQNQTGYFVITQPGPYVITVIGANGCRATVTGTR